MFYNIGHKSKVTEKKGFITLTNRVIVNVDRGKKGKRGRESDKECTVKQEKKWGERIRKVVSQKNEKERMLKEEDRKRKRTRKIKRDLQKGSFWERQNMMEDN